MGTFCKTIVAGTDGSETAQKAVDTALGLARMAQAQLHVVTAYRPLTDHEVYERQRGRQPEEAAGIDDAHDAHEVMAAVSKSAARAGVPVEVHARLGDPGEAIVTLAAEVGADLIIVGSVGMTGMRRLLGSVPNYVTHHAPCSVMVIRTA